MIPLIYILSGALPVLLIGYLVFRTFTSNQNKEISRLQNIINSISEEKQSQLLKLGNYEQEVRSLIEQQKELAELRISYQDTREKLVKAEMNYISANEKLDKQQEEMEQLGERFKFEFKNLAQNILEEKSEKFTALNEEKLKAIIEPLKKDIGAFKQKVEETYDKESKERFSLEKEVGRLIEMTQHVSEEAHNLTTALKGNNKMQGNWGELILESLLENSGLTKGREYFTQEFIRDKAGKIITDENGKGLQPDVMICYPDQRTIIIDSKVSLTAWDECIAQQDKSEQQRCLKEHIASMRRHIDGLSKKNYPKYALALDYVLLFIPIEPAFLEAVKTDVTLWKYAYEKKILLVSPTNLFAVLKIIADLWKVEQQNQHAIAIANKAGAMYDKFVLFLENFMGIGNKLQDANEQYTKAFNQLSEGKGNIINRVEDLKRMGANANKQIPDKLIQEALLQADTPLLE